MTEIYNLLENVNEKSLGVWSYIMKKFNGKKVKNNELLNNLKNAQDELEIAVNNYEFANDPALVDYYTYNIKAAQMRYEYLLRKVKEENIKNKGVE